MAKAYEQLTAVAEEPVTDKDLSPEEYLEKYRAVAGHGLTQDAPVAAWLVKGLVGGINLLAGFLEAGRDLGEHWETVLRAEHDRLAKLLEDKGQHKA